MKKTLFFFTRIFSQHYFTLFFLALIAFANNTFAQSNVGTGSQISFSGNASDFTTHGYVGYGGQNNVTYYMGFDNTNLYVGAFRSTNNFGGNDDFMVYIGTPSTATGTTTGTNPNNGGSGWSGNPTLPFSANYVAYCYTNGNTSQLETYSGGWSSPSPIAIQYLISGALEMRIPFSSIGNPASLYLTMYVGFQGGIYSNAPTTTGGNISGISPTMQDYFGGFGVTGSGCNPEVTINTAITNEVVNGAPVSGTVYGYVSETTATTYTATGSFSIANGGSINIGGSTLALGANTVSMGQTGLTTGNSATINYSSGTINTGTLNFVSNGYITGSNPATLNNVTINSGALTLTEAPTIDGTLQINGGNVTAAPNYGGSSMLAYNSGTSSPYTVFNEWTPNATSGAGVPFNVNIGNGINTAANFGSSTNYYQLNGTMTIASGSTFTQSSNGSSNGLKFGVGLSNSGTYSDNGRGTWFVGTTNGTLTSSTALTLNFLILNSASNLELGNSNITLAGNTNALQFLSSGGLDLETFTLTLSPGSTVLLNASGAKNIASTGGTGILALATSGSNTITPTSGSLITSSNVTLTLGAELIIGGASALTVNGTLQLNTGSPGGYINSNAPVYGTGSTLVYDNSGPYTVGTEWTASTAPGTGVAGVPCNVQIGNVTSGSALNLSSGTYYMSGNLTFSNNTGAALTSSGTLYIAGNWANNTSGAANFNGGTPTGTIVFNGSGAQSIGGSNTNAGGYDFNSLTINNTSGTSTGVTVGTPISTGTSGTLTLTTGVINTTGTNTLTVMNTATTAVSGGSSSAYVNGPLNWSLPISPGASVYNFPVGDAVHSGGAYLPFSVTTLTTSSTPVLQVQATNSAPPGASAGGSGGTALSSVSSSNEYWETNVISATVTSGSVSLTQASAIVPNNAIGTSTTVGGAYTSIAGTPNASPPPYSISNSTVTGLTGANYFIMAQAPLPTITSITYNNPTVTGETSPGVYYGQTVTLNGTNFTGITEVSIGSTNILTANFIGGTYTSTTIELVIPVAASGNITVSSSSLGIGPVFTPTYLGYLTDAHSSSDYNNTGTWLGLTGVQLPPASSLTTVNNSGITISATSNSPTTLTIISGASLNINNTSGSITATTIINGGTLTISAAATSAVTATTLTNNGTLTFSAAGTVSATTLTNAGTVTFSSGTISIAASGLLSNSSTYNGGGTLSMGAGATLTNTGTFTDVSGTTTFSNGGTVQGGTEATFNNLNLTTGTLTFTTPPLIDGIFIISGGNITAAPYYGGGSTLEYNVGYSRFVEWNATGVASLVTTAGYPNNVIINTGTYDVYNSTSGVARALAGTLTVNNGATMNFNGMNAVFTAGGDITINGGGTINMNTMSAAVNVGGSLTINGSTSSIGTLNMNSMSANFTVTGSVSNSGSLTLSTTSSADIYVGGNWTFTQNTNNTAVFTTNARAVFFNGSTQQVITREPSSGTLNFDYILIQSTGGGVQLASSPATSVNLNAANGGNGLNLSGTGTGGNVFDLNGNTATFASNINLQVSGAQSITSSLSGGSIAFSGSTSDINVSGSGSLSFSSAVTVNLNGGLNFGSGISTVNGILSINNGGFVTGNAPTYGTVSTLIYNTGNVFGRGIEWNSASGAGYPYSVTVASGTTLDAGSGGTYTGQTFNMGGSLTITGSLFMDVTFSNMTIPLNIAGGITITGSLSESNTGGGDVNLAGSWTNNGTFTNNGRSVSFNGSSTQNIGGSSATTFGFLNIDNTGSSVVINTSLTVTNSLILTSGTFNLNGNTCTLANGSLLERAAGTMSAAPTVTSGNTYSLQYDNTLTASVEFLNSSTAVQDLTIGSGATLTLSNNELINGNLNLYGDLNLATYSLDDQGQTASSSGTGNIVIESGSRLITGSSGSLFNVVGLFGNTPTDYTKVVTNPGSGTLTFDNNVTVGIGDGRMNMGTGNPVTVDGTLEINQGGSIITNSCYYAVGSTLLFYNGYDYQVQSTDNTWAPGSTTSGLPGIPYNVAVQDAATDLTIDDARSIRNNLTITDGTFTFQPTAGDAFSVGGNWSRSGATSAFSNNATAKVVFNGSASQTITCTANSNTETFNSLEISNSASSGSNTVTLSGSTNVVITDSIIFNEGIIVTGSNMVQTNINCIVKSGASNNSSYTVSWVNGNMRSYYNSAFTSIVFPVGNSSEANLAVVTNHSLSGITYFDANFHPVANGNNSQLAAWENTIGPPYTDYYFMNTGGFWTVEPDIQPSGGTYDINLYFNAFTGLVDNEFGILKRPSGSTTYAGFKTGGGTLNATNGAGRTVSGGYALRMGLSSFSEFGIGMSGGDVLPIQLVSFTGWNKVGINDLQWITASEYNTDYYSVERSTDAEHFEQIGTAQAQGTSTTSHTYDYTDYTPSEGINYYRLQVFYADETSGYSNIVALKSVVQSNNISVYPNPFETSANLSITGIEDQWINYRIVDALGRVMNSERLELNAGENIYEINTNNLSAGCYFVEVFDQNGNKISVNKLLKEE